MGKIVYNLEDGIKFVGVNSCNYEDLFSLAGLDYKKFDFACPQSWDDKRRELGVESHHGWYYDKGAFGKPLSLGDVLTKLFHSGRLFVIDTEES